MSKAHEPWADKYRPTSFNQIQGNGAAIGRLKDWAKNFPNDRTPRLLIGDPGTGKTATVEVIADWLDLQMIELNASDSRKSEDVKTIASQVSSPSVDGDRRVVLLDEADSWHHSTNLKPLYDALDNPANIVFVVVNDEWDTPNGIVKRTEQEKFNLQRRSVRAKLKKIIDKEDLDIADDDLERLADRPDLRSAINDLQLYAEVGEVPEGSRKWDTDEWAMLDRVLTNTDPDLGPQSPPDAAMWLDENTSSVYRGIELAMAYEAMSKADIATQRGHDDGFRHWKYSAAMLESVGRLRITEPYHGDELGYKDTSFPEWFRHSAPSATSESDEAVLYRELSDWEDGGMGISCSFDRFRAVWLDVLQDLETDEKHELVLSERLSDAAMQALGVKPHKHEEWLEVEAPESGEWEGKTLDASAW